MGVVAIRAFHQTFGHAMVSGEGKHRLDVPVTAEAEIGLLFLEETVVQPADLFGQLGHIEEHCLGET